MKSTRTQIDLTLIGTLIALAWCTMLAPAKAQQLAEGNKSIEWRVSLYSGDSDSTAESGTPGVNGVVGERGPSAHPSPIYTIGLYGNEVTVPDVMGLTWREASQKLTEAGLAASKFDIKSLAHDKVKYQKVAAGTTVKCGTNVQLTLYATVPNVIGKSLGDAYDILEKSNGFSMKYSSRFTSDLTVTHQTPAAGSEMLRGKEVRVNCMVRVPDVTGMCVEKAKQALREAKLNPTVRVAHKSDDIVLNQMNAGRMVVANSTIGLVPGVWVPNFIGCNLNDIKEKLQESGIKAVPVTRVQRTMLSSQHGKIDFEDQSVRAGNYISRTATLKIAAVQYVYQPERRILPVPCPPIVIPRCNTSGGGFCAPTPRTPSNCPTTGGCPTLPRAKNCGGGGLGF